LLAELQEYDLVHFAGHSFYDPQTPSKSGWRLHADILTAGELSKCSHPPRVVFSNSCQAGASAEWSGAESYEGLAFGIGSAFLLAGVQNYIGPLWEVDDEESRLFATTFYQRLGAGLSLGEALLSTRHAIIQRKGWNSLTWASYVLYGDPACTLLPSRQEETESASFVIHSPTALTGRGTNLTVSAKSKASLSPPSKEKHFSSPVWYVGLGLATLTASVLLVPPVLQHFRQRQPPEALQNDRSLPYPSKPSVVVLPFLNLSHDPEQEYFSDGISEDLITDLSKLSNLFVIARNSAFSYKGKTVTPQQISKELGVRYVLEGSVRKADNRVRITAQLVDTTTNSPLWAERYDRPWHDIFALQDEITGKIVASLRVQIAPEEQKRLGRIPTNNLEAYDLFLRGWMLYGQTTEETTQQARHLFEQATRLDNNYAEAYAALAATYLLEWTWQWQQTPQTLDRALSLAYRATSLNDALSSAHMVLGNVFLWKKEHDRALAATEKAIALDPNDAEGYATLGEILTWMGKPEDALEWIQKAMRLNPRASTSYLWLLGHAHRLAGRCEAAIAVQREVLRESPTHIGAHVELVVCASELGHEGQARAEVAEIKQISPQISLESLRRSLPYKDDGLREHLLTHLSNAGLR
jgi:TolB-like protein/tetratricopeptide (TPR) repeat protein